MGQGTESERREELLLVVLLSKKRLVLMHEQTGHGTATLGPQEKLQIRSRIDHQPARRDCGVRRQQPEGFGETGQGIIATGASSSSCPPPPPPLWFGPHAESHSPSSTAAEEQSWKALTTPINQLLPIYPAKFSWRFPLLSSHLICSGESRGKAPGCRIWKPAISLAARLKFLSRKGGFLWLLLWLFPRAWGWSVAVCVRVLASADVACDVFV